MEECLEIVLKESHHFFSAFALQVFKMFGKIEYLRKTLMVF